MRGAVAAVLERAYLEYIRVVPALAQCGVREDEACRLFEAEQTFLVLENQVIRGNIIAELTAALELAVNSASSFLINAEIAAMRGMNIDAIEICHILRVKQSTVSVHDRNVFFLKNMPELAKRLMAIRIVLPVMRHFVNEEQRQRLNALVEQLCFLLKVGDDRFPNLHTAHVAFGDVADDFALVDDITIGEGDGSINGIDL